MIGDAIPLDKILARWVTPGLKAAGFIKSGKTYRKLDPDGNWAIINFQGTIGTHPQRVERLFFVNIAVAVTAHLELMDVVLGSDRSQKPTQGSGLWTDRVFPPEDVEYDPGQFRDQRWWYGDDESAQRVGQHLERIIPRQALPTLDRLLDRAELISELRHRLAPGGRVALLIDDGPSEQLDEAIRQAKDAGDDQVVDWALARLQKMA